MEKKKVDSKILLVTLVLVLIVLLLLNFLLKKNRTDEIWNYKEIKSAKSITYKGDKLTNRETYYILENIVKQYIESYINVYNEDKIMYKDYYKYLTLDYKEYLSKNEYKQVAEKFLNKFYNTIDSDYEWMDTNAIIKSVYEFDNNIYLCELKSNSRKETGYMAIQLNTNRLAFNIVYIE